MQAGVCNSSKLTSSVSSKSIDVTRHSYLNDVLSCARDTNLDLLYVNHQHILPVQEPLPFERRRDSNNDPGVQAGVTSKPVRRCQAGSIQPCSLGIPALE